MLLCVPDLHSHKMCLEWIKVETCGRLRFSCKAHLILAQTNKLCPLPSAPDRSGALQGWEQLEPLLAKKPRPQSSYYHGTASAGKMCLKELHKLRSTNAKES